MLSVLKSRTKPPTKTNSPRPSVTDSKPPIPDASGTEAFWCPNGFAILFALPAGNLIPEMIVRQIGQLVKLLCFADKLLRRRPLITRGDMR